jgi:lipopolysaccharide transport system ATP-binding protein
MERKKVMIALEDVTLSYPIRSGFLKWSKYYPLRNISFEIYRGETIGIIGKNGAGKSSLLRALAGIVEPESGKIMHYHDSITLLAIGVGFVPHLTGRENAILSGMLLGMSKKEVEAKMDEIIEFSDLGEFIDQPLRIYSTGMRARIAFSTAIQANPDVTLIDEMLGVGDEDFKLKSLRHIKALMRSDKTVVLVSHQIQFVKEMCNRVAWIEHGVLQFVGDTAEALERYTEASKKKI